MQFSIIPEMISSKNIRFFDERNMELVLCEKVISNFITPFNQPFLIVDRFAKKTIKKVEIIPIGTVIELKKLGFVISVLEAKSKGIRFKGQKKIYILEKLSERIPGARRLDYIPVNHKLQKDKLNKRVRLVGPNAGFPYYKSEYGDCGPWKEIENEHKS